MCDILCNFSKLAKDSFLDCNISFRDGLFLRLTSLHNTELRSIVGYSAWLERVQIGKTRAIASLEATKIWSGKQQKNMTIEQE